jgi:hypothetical protein
MNARSAAIWLVWTTLVVEGIARLAMSTDAMTRRLYGRGLAADTLAIEAWTARSLDAFLAQRTSIPITWHPTRGWTTRPDTEVRAAIDATEPLQTTLDARGFRVSPGTPGGPVLLALGDSFAFGSEVSDEQVWTHTVHARHPHLDIRNAAVPGYGHDQMWMRLQALSEDRPHVIVLPWIDTDSTRNVRDVFVWAKPRFALDGDTLTQVSAPPTPDAMVQRYRWRSRAWDLLRVTWSLARPSEPPDPAPLTVALGHAIADEAASRGAAAVFVRAPVSWQLDEGRARYHNGPDAGTFAAVCTHPHVHCHDVGDAFFDAREAGVALERVSHWTPAGQRLLGEGIAHVLDELAAAP